MGNRAIYQDGWWAGALHSIPWNYHRSEDFGKDRWELYDLTHDYSQADNLAGSQPQRLRAMQRLFDREARANHVYPLNNSFGKNGFGGEQPRLLDGRAEFTFVPGTERIPASQAPDFARSHEIAVRLAPGERSRNGVLVADGGNQGGFVFYLRDGRPTYEINYRGGRMRQVIAAPEALPNEAREVRYVYDADPTHGKRGRGRILVDGRTVAHAEIDWFEPPTFVAEFDVFTIGRPAIGRITADATAEQVFAKGLESVTVALR